MSGKQLIGLGVITAVVAVAALVVSGQRDMGGAGAQELLYPALDARLNNIVRVKVHTAGASPVTIERRRGTWMVADRDGYPADVSQLRDGLIALAQAKLVESKTRDPKHYAALGVQAIDEAQAGTQEIRVEGEDDAEFAHVIVGDTAPGGGSYVRRVGRVQSWLVSENIVFPATASDWLAKGLIDLQSEHIRRIEVQPAQGPAYTLVKSGPDDVSFELESERRGQQVSQNKIDLLATALEGLTLTDVLAEDQAPEGDIPWGLARFETFDGLVVETRTREVDGKDYLQLSARFDSTRAQADPGAGEDMQNGKSSASGSAVAERPPGSAKEDVKARVQGLQRRFRGRVFLVSGGETSPLRYALSELLQ